MFKTLTTPLGLATVLVAAGLFYGGSAEARDRNNDRDRNSDHNRDRDRDHDRNRGGLSLSFGGPGYYAPAVERVYVPGHYETRYETVLVQPSRVERRWIPDAIETRVDRYGREYSVIVRRGYWEEYAQPPQYENRAVSVWVPGYYQDVSVGSPRPRFNIGAFFHF
ncbi:MAG: hypothetical protein HY291_11210 [Planctomycetes bacterium]|nr:hypothetical protein [Planctomycetota bacterium]